MDKIQLTLSPYARNILEELRRHAGGLLKVREPDLIRLSKVPAVRIIDARDELEKCLNELTEHDFITYEKQGDRYFIRDKGWRVLGRSSKVPGADFQEEAEPPATARERFERYMSRQAQDGVSEAAEENSFETTQEASRNLENKTPKELAESHRKTIEELAAEPSGPKERFRRYMSR